MRRIPVPAAPLPPLNGYVMSHGSLYRESRSLWQHDSRHSVTHSYRRWRNDPLSCHGRSPAPQVCYEPGRSFFIRLVSLPDTVPAFLN